MFTSLSKSIIMYVLFQLQITRILHILQYLIKFHWVEHSERIDIELFYLIGFQ